jgi:hypothetical protein
MSNETQLAKLNLMPRNERKRAQKRRKKLVGEERERIPPTWGIFPTSKPFLLNH